MREDQWVVFNNYLKICTFAEHLLRFCFEE